MFPKIVHQIWFDFGTKDLSAQHKFLIEHTKKQSIESGFEYNLWTYEMAQKLISQHYPYFVYFFFKKSKFNIIKCDFFRYVLMYHFGGLYIDLDFYILKPLNELYSDIQHNKLSIDSKSATVILTEEWYNSAFLNNGSFHNGFLLSIAKQMFWFDLLSDINILIDDVKDFKINQDVWDKTGTCKLRKHFFTEKLKNSTIAYLPHYFMCPYKCIEKKTKETLLCSNANIIPYDLRKSDWCFFSLDEITSDLSLLISLKNCYMVCVYLHSGSLWL